MIIKIGRINIIKAEKRLVFVRNKDKFIVPVFAKLRLDNYSNSDFGASAFIKTTN